MKNTQLKCGTYLQCLNPCKGYPNNYSVNLNFSNNNLTSTFGTGAVRTIGCLIPNGTYILPRVFPPESSSSPYNKALYTYNQSLANSFISASSGNLLISLSFCGNTNIPLASFVGTNYFGNPVLSISLTQETFQNPPFPAFPFFECFTGDAYVYNTAGVVAPDCSGINTLALQDCCDRGVICFNVFGPSSQPAFSSSNGQPCSCQVPTSIQITPL